MKLKLERKHSSKSATLIFATNMDTEMKGEIEKKQEKIRNVSYVT